MLVLCYNSMGDVMTAKSELRFIKRLPPFMKASEVAKRLHKAKKTVIHKQSEQTDLALESELRMCEIRRCLPILKELEYDKKTS